MGLKWPNSVSVGARPSSRDGVVAYNRFGVVGWISLQLPKLVLVKPVSTWLVELTTLLVDCVDEEGDDIAETAEEGMGCLS